ncbi:iron-sulfur cluster assembly accessory protein [archaeon]|jgi:iron-sulfur cluster assembly accessory protein|nr:iron-sulfur cluster assembly accessory protein [archaeon]MBT6698279.1 iron-sulfur cluster assembly accessory protein [archaeon]
MTQVIPNNQETQSQKAITKQTLIGDIVDQYPHLVPTLLSFGVHCVGCHVSPFEPLGEGLAGHGMDEAKIQDCLEKLNKAHQEHLGSQGAKKTQNQDIQNSISKEESTKELTLTLTQKAVDKIKELTKEHKKNALMIAVKPGGCSGYEYVLELVEDKDKQENQHIISQDDVKVFIDKESLKIMNGSQIDYQNTLQDAGFKINNPSAKNTCGCGNSFS